jgi:flagellar biosynthesis chaperone FliJ
MSGSQDSLRRSLGKLAELQQLQLDRQQAKLVAQQQLCQRVQGTVDRLDALGAQATLTGVALPGLAQNSAAYKQAMRGWADQQRAELARREAELALAKADTLAAARKQETLRQLVDRADARVRTEQARRDQKGQDEIASQSAQNDSAYGGLSAFGALGGFGPMSRNTDRGNRG